LIVKIGTCGFQRSRKLHFNNLDVVEVQQTFYDPPSEETLKKWREEAPPRFEFTVKVWMLITHEYNKMLWRKIKRKIPGDPKDYGGFKLNKNTLWALEETLKAARTLRARILVFQSPQSYKPTKENIERIERFFKEVDLEEFEVVWEPRGEWWNKPEVLKKLHEDLGLIIAGDVLRGRLPRHKQDILYTRLHGLGGKEVNYKYKYTDEDLHKLKSIIEEYNAREAYVLFNNVYAYEDAVRFKNLIST
jgi:uncharacterized protein YecE (DUF72 family)